MGKLFESGDAGDMNMDFGWFQKARERF